MKRIKILLQVVNFVLAAFCVALLISCAQMTCPKATIESVPSDCQVKNAGDWFNYCMEGEYEGEYGCCQYQCREVECEGIYGRYIDCVELGTVQVSYRCNQEAGQCYQQ